MITYTYCIVFYIYNQINARALIGQSAVGYCYYKPTEKSRVFWIIIEVYKFFSCSTNIPRGLSAFII